MLRGEERDIQTLAAVQLATRARIGIQGESRERSESIMMMMTTTMMVEAWLALVSSSRPRPRPIPTPDGVSGDFVLTDSVDEIKGQPATRNKISASTAFYSTDLAKTSFLLSHPAANHTTQRRGSAPSPRPSQDFFTASA